MKSGILEKIKMAAVNKHNNITLNIINTKANHFWFPG